MSSEGKEWIVRLSRAIEIRPPDSDTLERMVRPGRDHGWVGIELEGFNPETIDEGRVENVLQSCLKFWDNLDIDREGGRVRFEVKGELAVGAVMRTLSGYRLGDGDGTISVRVLREEDSGEAQGKDSNFEGGQQGIRRGEQEERFARSLSSKHYGLVQPQEDRSVMGREGKITEGERSYSRGRSHSRDRGRLRSKSLSTSRSRSPRSLSRASPRNQRCHGKEKGSDRKGSRKKGAEDEEEGQERRRRKRGIKKRSSHRTPSHSLSRSRSRSPRRRHVHRHERHLSRTRSRSTSPRHHRHRKTSRRSPSSSPISSRATRQRSRYDNRSRSSSRSRSPHRISSRKKHDKRSITPLSLQRHYETNHHSPGPSQQHLSSAQTPHYDGRYGYPMSMHPNLSHFQQFPPPPPPHYQPHPTFTSTPPLPPPSNYFSQPTPLASYPIHPNYTQPRLPPNQNVYTRFPSAPSPDLTIYTPTTHYERSQIAENTIRQITENLERNRQRNRLAGRELRAQGEGRYLMGYRE